MGEDARRERDLFERLSAADPAQGATPQLDALRRRVDARRTADGTPAAGDPAPHAAAPTSPAPDTAAPHTAAPHAAAPDAAAPGGAAPAPVALPLVPAASRRPRWSRRGWAVAAAVAGFAVAGAGGYAVGLRHDSPAASDAGAAGTPAQDADARDLAAIAAAGGFAVQGSAAPSLSLGGSAAGTFAEGDAAGAGPLRSLEAAGLAAPSPRMLLSPWGTGRTVFHHHGLSDEAGTATVFALDPSGVANAETAARLAAALGVEGDPVASTSHWTSGGPAPRWAVGPEDRSGPSVSLVGDGSASFSYWNPLIHPWECSGFVVTPMPVPLPGDVPTAIPLPGVLGEVAEPEWADMPVPDVVMPDEWVPAPWPGLGRTGCEEPAPATLSDAEAAAALGDLMRTLGVDPAGFEVEVQPGGEGAPLRWVTAWQVVDGTRTQASWSAGITDAGIVDLTGFLAPVVDLGEYPVVSPAEAVQRLGDPRFGASLVSFGPVAEPDFFPLPMWDALPSDRDGGDGQGTVPATPRPGAPLPWAVTERTIVDARLGLAHQWTADGATLFVPTYELTDDHGSVWSTIAVAESALDFTRS